VLVAEQLAGEHARLLQVAVRGVQVGAVQRRGA
jgi:hypothetical protein